MVFKDEQLQRLIGLTLRTGVLVAVAIGILGGSIFLGTHSGDAVSFKTFAGAHSLYASPLETVRRAFHPQSGAIGNRGLAIAQVGIICLLLTPIIRVALSILGFARERDTIYVAITSIVLATLTCSLLLH